MTPTPEETDLWIALNDVHRAIHHEMEQALTAEGLPPLNWYDILWAVEMSGEEGVWARNLRDWLLFEQSNLSRLLSRLVREGLIDETRCDRDRRAKTLRITPKGAQMRLRMWRIYGDLIHRHMEELMQAGHAPEMLAAFRALLTRHGWGMARRDGPSQTGH